MNSNKLIVRIKSAQLAFHGSGDIDVHSPDFFTVPCMDSHVLLKYTGVESAIFKEEDKIDVVVITATGKYHDQVESAQQAYDFACNIVTKDIRKALNRPMVEESEEENDES